MVEVIYCEMMLPQKVNYEIWSTDIPQWVELECDAPTPKRGGGDKGQGTREEHADTDQDGSDAMCLAEHHSAKRHRRSCVHMFPFALSTGSSAGSDRKSRFLCVVHVLEFGVGPASML